MRYTEQDLADLGVHRIEVPIPYVAAGGPVNAYAIEEAGGGLLLFDAGLGTDVAHEAVLAGLARIGRRPADVARIVVSHGHPDHFGGARFLQERRGGELPVFAHAADEPKISERGPRARDRRDHYQAYLVKLGVPQEAIARAQQFWEADAALAPRVPAVGTVHEGDVLRTRHLALRVLHMPGHTPGMVCLHDPGARILLSSDHLLERISPNPIIELGPNGEEDHFRPLLAYLASVERTRALDVDTVLPGHRGPFAGHRAVIDALLGFHRKRQARIEEVLAAGPATAYELGRTIMPRAPAGQGFLVVSETIANLEVLEARGRVVRELGGGVYRFALAA